MATEAAAPAIAAAEFIDDVDKFMQGKTAEEQLEKIRQQLQSFKQQEQMLLLRRERLLDRQPEIKMALEAVVGLIDQKSKAEPLLVDFELTENIYAKAAVQDADSVNLWLGANVMVEYPLAEAKELLSTQLEACERSLKQAAKDLETVKNNTTITEVSMARVFNWDVEQRRKAKQAAAGSS
jgi:prefoldin subunit 5